MLNVASMLVIMQSNLNEYKFSKNRVPIHCALLCTIILGNHKVRGQTRDEKKCKPQLITEVSSTCSWILSTIAGSMTSSPSWTVSSCKNLFQTRPSWALQAVISSLLPFWIVQVMLSPSRTFQSFPQILTSFPTLTITSDGFRVTYENESLP